MARKTTRKKTGKTARKTTRKKAARRKAKAPAGRPMRMTDAEKKTILEKAKSGQSARQIAADVNRSYVTVLNFINKSRRGPKPGRRGRAAAGRPAKAGTGTARLRSAQKAFDASLNELLAAQAEASTATLIERLRKL